MSFLLKIALDLLVCFYQISRDLPWANPTLPRAFITKRSDKRQVHKSGLIGSGSLATLADFNPKGCHYHFREKSSTVAAVLSTLTSGLCPDVADVQHVILD